MVHDYAEDLLQSMQIIATECYKDQKFDETVICTIVNDSDCKNGRYTVSDGTIKFDAYSESQDYRIDDVVRVLVIKGDYSKNKYITGKCVSDEDSQPLTYTSVSDSVLDMTGNLFSTPVELPGLMANGDIAETCIWSMSLKDSEFKDIQQNSIYDAIVLKADFKTRLSEYDIMAGTYGLRMDVYVTTSGNNTGLYRKQFYLDSSMMFGDPYNFVIYSGQDAKFNIANSDTIHTISLYFYQDSNFIYRTNGGEYKELPISVVGNNLLISDIYVGMGTDLENIEDNKFVIYTHDDLKYNIDDTETSNEKEIGLIWYNKDEETGKYIGFSDGRVRNSDGTDNIHYDEINYLKKQQTINRLMAQQGKYDVPNTEDGLSLAADFDEIEPLLKSIDKIVFQNLFAEFKNFNNRLASISHIDEIKTLFNSWIDTTTGYFYTKPGKFDNIVQSINNYYEKGLAYAAAVQRGETQLDEDGKEIPYSKPSDNLSDLEEQLVNMTDGQENQGLLTWIIDQITNAELVNEDGTLIAFLPRLKEILTQSYSSFLGAYDAYESRILKVLNLLEDSINEFKELSSDNSSKFNSLLSFDNPNDFDEYEAEDTSKYDNLYCIYWYKYQSGHINEDDPFGGTDWKRLEETNIGLPTPYEEEQADEDIDINYYPAKPLNTDAHALLTINLPVEHEVEKYKAVLIYNHEPFTSNEIVFTNERVALDEEIKNNILIEHGDNSQDYYPLYGVDNTLIDATAYNRPRHLRLRYLDEQGNFDDSKLANASVYWYIPQNATMLRYDLSDLSAIEKENGEENIVVSAGFTNDIPEVNEQGETINNNIQDEEFHRDGYTCFYKQITTNDEGGINSQDRYFTYRIKDYYNPTNTANTIYCVVVKGQTKFETSIDLSFSTFGSNGTDYTLKISPLTSQMGIGGDSGSEEGATPFEFNITLYDYNNEKINIVENNTDVPVGSAVLGSIEIIGPEEVKQTISPKNIMFVDGSVNGKIIIENDISECYYRVLTASVKIKWTAQNEELDEDAQVTAVGKQGRTVELSTYYVIPYTPHLEYYIEGPSTVVYDSQGNNPSYYKNPFRLFKNTNVLSADNEELQGVESQEVEGISWHMIYYTCKGDLYDKLDDKTKNECKLLMSYMPQLAEDNTLVPCNMYLVVDEESTNADLSNLYPVVICEDQNEVVIWAQPIYLMQNRYPSAMLNAWDGKLEIDEENGTILSNLVGAGKKNADNSFSGVLMGEIETKSGIQIDGGNTLERSLANTQTGMGLYGFHEGAQSFGFNINGTSFLGKSGKGRISFDGNHGFIYSGSWLNSFKRYREYDESIEDIKFPDDYKEVDGKKQYWTGTYNNPFMVSDAGVSLNQGSDGMAIDLQNGHIDAFNFRLTSSNIYLNSNPSDLPEGNPTSQDQYDNYYFRIGHDGTLRNPYTNDTPGQTNGYFAMDKQGNIVLKVNSLYIAEQPPNANLLKQTSPVKQYTRNEEGELTYSWGPVDVWTVEAPNAVTGGPIGSAPGADDVPASEANISDACYDRPRYLNVVGTGSTKVLSQDVTRIRANTEYTVSGYALRTHTQGDLILTIEILDPESGLIIADASEWVNSDNTIECNYDDWTYFAYTFKTKEVNDNTIRIQFSASAGYGLWHLKLEEGSRATEWISANGEEDLALLSESERADLYLAQDVIFDKLVTDPKTGKKMVGIWMVDEGSASGRKELYINATYISTGILRSNDWDGEISYDENENTYSISKTPSVGMYINLNEGKIWSKNFQLNAWDSSASKGLWLDSNPKNDTNYYFLVGNQNESYIGYTKAGDLTIRVNNLYISDESIDKYVEGKIPGQLTYDDIMEMISGGWEGIYSQDGKYYISADTIKAGKLEANYITGGMSSDVTIGGWSISNEYGSCISKTYTTSSSPITTYYTGMYSVWPSSKTHTIAELPSNNWRFIVGSREGGAITNPTSTTEGSKYNFHFGVTREGYLAAENAYIDGNIKVGSGAIYGDLLISGGGKIRLVGGSGAGFILNSNGLFSAKDENGYNGGFRFEETTIFMNNVVLGSTYIDGNPETSTHFTNQIFIGNKNCTLEEYIKYVINQGDNPWA